MRRLHFRPFLLGLATLGTLALTAADGPTVMTPLVWKPTSALLSSGTVNLTPFATLKIAIRPLTDNRAEKTRLGENVEKPATRYIGTADDVAPYVTKHLLALLQQPGLPLTDKTDGAAITLSGELQRFYVIEKDTYAGDFRALLQVESAGKVLWKGLVVGQATRFGRSYKTENYHEALSDSLVEAVSHLLSDKTFLEALAGQAPAQAAPAAR